MRARERAHPGIIATIAAGWRALASRRAASRTEGVCVYDIVIRNGLLVDGSGAAPVHADIAVAEGRIAAIGKLGDGARRVVDASDCVVSPGFIDPHTHYDAQACWDPTISPSSWHGVTSVVMGNCGVGIAPCRPQDREAAMHDLVNVESIPYDVLQAGIDWNWQSFPEYLQALIARRPALNLGVLAPLTPFRQFVIGEEAPDRAATAEETAAIKALLKEAVAAGALGFSTSVLSQHLGLHGRPLACRSASQAELVAYANGLREAGRGVIEMALTRQVSLVSDEEYALLDLMLTESQRPVTFIALLDRDDMPDACRDTLRQIEPLMRRGAVPQVMARPLTREVSMRKPFTFASFPSFRAVLNRSKEEQARIYADPDFRNAFRADIARPGVVFSGDWTRVFVNEAKAPALKPLEGRTIHDIAAERGRDGVDTLLDLTLEDDLEIEFTMFLFNVTEARVPPLLTDPRTLISLSDGGAHVDAVCDAGYGTYLLGRWVRERGIMPIEHAIRRLTSEPADLFGIADRGRLKVGLAADIAILDPATVNSPDRGEKRYDLPNNGKRLVMPSQGVEMTIVNGQVAYEKGAVTEARAGQLLRP